RGGWPRSFAQGGSGSHGRTRAGRLASGRRLVFSASETVGMQARPARGVSSRHRGEGESAQADHEETKEKSTMKVEIIFKGFTIERFYPAAIERVFDAHADPMKRRRWFAEGKGFHIDEYSLDFRIGGFERTRFRFGDGPPMTYDGVYLDIVPLERIVFAYAMTIGGASLSSSLAAVELFAKG